MRRADELRGEARRKRREAADLEISACMSSRSGRNDAIDMEREAHVLRWEASRLEDEARRKERVY